MGLSSSSLSSVDNLVSVDYLEFPLTNLFQILTQCYLWQCADMIWKRGLCPHLFQKKGAQKGRKSNLFNWDMERLFFVRFWCRFFHSIPYESSFHKYANGFLLSVIVFEINEGEIGKNPNLKNFYFSSDFNGDFFIGILMKN